MTRQPDLFDPPEATAGPVFRSEAEMEPLRITLNAMLAEARGAARLPWSYTRATVLELQMQGMSRLLPEGEALREAFFAELDRLYALEPVPSG